MSYEKEYNFWESNPELYWKEKSSNIHWFKPYKKILSRDPKGKYVWFKDGELNTCFNCLDRHVNEGLGKKNAIIYDSPISKKKKFI